MRHGDTLVSNASDVICIFAVPVPGLREVDPQCPALRDTVVSNGPLVMFDFRGPTLPLPKGAVLSDEADSGLRC